jgi:hypothetical protein
MKIILVIMAIVSVGLTSFATDAGNVSANTATNASEPVSVTAKKRLRHVGQNIEKLGKKAGKKLGVKNVSDSSGVEAVATPAGQ